MVMTSRPLAIKRLITLKAKRLGVFLGELAWHNGNAAACAFGIRNNCRAIRSQVAPLHGKVLDKILFEGFAC